MAKFSCANNFFQFCTASSTDIPLPKSEIFSITSNTSRHVKPFFACQERTSTPFCVCSSTHCVAQGIQGSPCACHQKLQAETRASPPHNLWGPLKLLCGHLRLIMLCLPSPPSNSNFTESAPNVTTIERLKSTLLFYTDSAHGVITLILCLLSTLKIPAIGYLEEGGSRGTSLHSYLGCYSAEEIPLCDHSRGKCRSSELPGALFNSPPMPLSHLTEQVSVPIPP